MRRHPIRLMQLRSHFACSIPIPSTSPRFCRKLRPGSVLEWFSFFHFQSQQGVISATNHNAHCGEVAWRLTSAVPALLAERARSVWLPNSVQDRPKEHADDSRLWRGIDKAKVFKLPEKVFQYHDFTPAVPPLHAQMLVQSGTARPSLDDPLNFQRMTMLTSGVKGLSLSAAHGRRL